MFKNVASQSVTLYVVDSATGLPKTGDAANQVFYVSKDDGSVTAISANSGVPTEVNSSTAKGLYKIALSQVETNADKLLFSGTSSTSGIVVVPTVIYTLPASFTALTTAAIATGVWTDTTAGDFTVSASIGKSVMNGVSLGTGLTVNILTNLPSIPANWLTAAGINAGALNGKGDWLLASSYTAPTNLTAAQIATGIWQDAVSGDFTVSGSIGKILFNTLPVVHSGTAAGGGSTTITLDSGASATDSAYVNQLIYITSGTGVGQARYCTAYVGSTKVATVRAWTTNPDNTSQFAVIPDDFAAANLDVAISTRMATYTQPTGFLAQTFPGGILANQTNITGGTITTVTNVTNAPTAGDFTTVMKASLNLATPTVGIAAGAISDTSFTLPTDIAGVATGFLGRLMQLWQRFFGKVINDTNTGTIKSYLSDGSTVRTTQTTSSSGGVQQVDKAS